MLGLSVGKILIVAAAVGALVVGTKIFRQISRQSGGSAEQPATATREDAAADLIKCQACGAYAAKNCGKPGCPLAS